MNIRPKGYVTLLELMVELDMSKSALDRLITQKIITKRKKFGNKYYYNIASVKKEILDNFNKGNT